jgi:molecular chaperone DnaK
MADANPLGPCFGIDLGTTASAIALVQNGTPKVLTVHGSTLLPSVVMFPRGGEPIVGQSALNALELDPLRGVTSSKRHMGTTDAWVIDGVTVTPVDVAERILRSLVHGAEKSCGIRPRRVVITVPAWFTQTQRADTKAAGERAGLVVERILNEPTAAALAHAHGQDLRRKVLVYDLGGGTFDVSLVEQDGPVVEVKASHGDSRLGGDDIDTALADHVLTRLGETDSALRDAVEKSQAARVRLRMAVEEAKITLSETTQVTVRVPFLLELDGVARHLEMELHRNELDEVAEPYLERTLRSVDQVFKDTGLTPKDIDELLLVGGSTLQPLVWHTLHGRYNLEGSYAISPRLVVALGAAIQGAIIDGSRTDGILVDVAPYPLSVGSLSWMGDTEFYMCHVITPRNAPLPARHSDTFYTTSPRQPKLLITIFQGASPAPSQNTLLAQLEIDNIPPAPPGRTDRPFRVTMRHDLDGMVQIDVVDELSGQITSGTVAADGAEQGALREALVDRMEKDGVPMWEEEDDEDRVETEGGGFEAPASDADEARRTLQAILVARETLAAEHPTEIAGLLDLANEGLAAAERDDLSAMLEIYEEISDRMFQLGIYL